MTNSNKKTEKRYVNQKMKEPMSRLEVYTTFQTMMDDFKKDFYHHNGLMLAQTVHFMNVTIQLLLKKGIFTQQEFDKLSVELGEKEKAGFKKKQESDKKNGKEKNKKSNLSK